jgi:hypothetical protein
LYIVELMKMRLRGAVAGVLGLVLVALALWSQRSAMRLPRLKLKVKLEEEEAMPRSAAQLCVFVVSCNRSQLLRRTLRSLTAHLGAEEAALRAELVLVEQGGTGSTRRAVMREHSSSLASVALASEARGYGWPFNLGFAALCRAPFVAVVEDDFPILSDARALLRRPDVFTHAIELLVCNTKHERFFFFFFFTSFPWTEGGGEGCWCGAEERSLAAGTRTVRRRAAQIHQWLRNVLVSRKSCLWQLHQQCCCVR